MELSAKITDGHQAEIAHQASTPVVMDSDESGPGLL